MPYGEAKATIQEAGSGVEGLTFQEALGTGRFWLLFLVSVCFGYYRLTILTHFVPHVTDLGISSSIAARSVAIIGGADIIGRIIGGAIADRIGSKRAYQVFWVLVIITLSVLLVAKEVWHFYLFAIFFGLTNATKLAFQSLAVAEFLGLRSHGVIFGSHVFAGFIGGAVGIVLSGYIFDVTGSYQLAFIISVAVSILGLVAISLVKSTGREKSIEGS